MELIREFSNWLWGGPVMVMLVGTGLYLSIRMKFLQVRHAPHAFGALRGKYRDPDDPGEISPFEALSTALSATVGTGNIVGVAAAIMAGGPGAVFWMWVTAVVGMASKFTSCTLAVHFRRVDPSGESHVGPMHYIEKGMGPRFKWLAVSFAVFLAVASFGVGNMFQAKSIAQASGGLLWGHGTELSMGYNFAAGVTIAALVALVILGGIKRIAHVAGKLVPLMCVLYLATGLIILIRNMDVIPHGLSLIFSQAFQAPESVSGGLLGGVIRSGVARGVFSNEAGLGTAAIAHGAARTREPVRQGLVAMLGPLIDTLIVCSVTALVIICTGAYETAELRGQLTSIAFDRGLPGARYMVSLGIILFAFSTIIAWSYYGDRAVDYLFGAGAVLPYRLLYVGVLIVGAVRPLEQVIIICDVMNGLMAFPNLIAIIVLAPLVIRLKDDYFRRVTAARDTRSA